MVVLALRGDGGDRLTGRSQTQQVSRPTSAQPVISFQGSQGYIKIPAPTPDSPDGVRVFTFYLSRESKDKPQSSFECIRQGVSRAGQSHLDCVGSIQDKITVCATDESYQLTRDRMSQVEKETWSRAAIEIKPGASCRNKGAKVPSKPDSSMEVTPSEKPPPVFLTPAAKKCHYTTSESKPLRAWLVHQLALRPHRKTDLLQRLEKSTVPPRDRADLSPVLETVGRLNPKDNSYTLKEELFQQVQKDWAGYSSEEKQHIARVLLRKQSSGAPMRPIQPSNRPRKETESVTNQNTVRKTAEVKRSAPSEGPERQASKKLKESDLMKRAPADRQPKAPTLANPGPDTLRTPSCASHSPNAFVKQSNKFQETIDRCSKGDDLEKRIGDRPEPRRTPSPPGHDTAQQNCQSNKKPKRHKEDGVEQDSSDEEEEDDDWEEEALRLERCLSYPEEKEQLVASSPASPETPDYFRKYKGITSLEQRQVYEEDFDADYTEYLDLHSKIGKVTERFHQLGSRIKKLQPGTSEHKMLEEKILTAYKKFKKTYPGYPEDKKRCEYLHDKLSHIKQVILEYEEKTKPS
ncbi:RNA polymerase II elongation factor ELL3 isoform X2 [Ambystoma mexicanum]|uniref:RNA polymerase II elongation factor ELL3 isoform X2 n=1 Tax=Ambystoma mexicanum TaxID=8296 RepID=UPI0037E91E19